MYTRLLAGAFLTYQNKVLLIKRGMHKELGPGMWSGIGGHLEPEELSNPRKINHLAAIYREIKEEAGVSPEELLNLDLRYIITLINRTRNEIENVYYYFGKVSGEFEPPYCDEGVLHWVDFKDVKDLPMTFFVKETILHWLDNRDKDNVFLVGINKDNDKSTFVELSENQAVVQKESVKSWEVGKITNTVIKLLNLPITTDTPVYIGETNITHIKISHPADFAKYHGFIEEIINSPDYVGLNNKDNSIEYVKVINIDNEFVKVAVRVTTKGKFFVRSLYALNKNRVNNFIAKGTLIKYENCIDIK